MNYVSGDVDCWKVGSPDVACACSWRPVKTLEKEKADKCPVCGSFSERGDVNTFAALKSGVHHA